MAIDRLTDATTALRTRGAEIARRKPAAAILVAALPLLVGLAAIRLLGPFHPRIHDEYSHLYAADTFAHGRLTNPVHPFWRHFETFDVISQPTTMSRKPPAPGLFLALGQALTGEPIAGSMVSVSLAALATYWALLAWLPPGWALGGALLAGLHPQMFEWSVNYWGGGIGVLGGALVLGGWRRCRDRPTPAAGTLFGLGLALLANTRPFEGLVLSLPPTADLAWRLLRGDGSRRADLSRAAVPAALVLALTAAAMGYYNHRVTGSALRFPYMVYEEAYDSTPLFIWQKAKPPYHYDNPEFEEFWNRWNYNLVTGQDTVEGCLSLLEAKLSSLSSLWLTPFPLKVLFAAGMLGLAPPSLALLTGYFVLGITAPTRAPMLAHYSAPGGALFFLVVLLALHRASTWRWRRVPVGAALVAATVAACLVHDWRTFRSFPPGSWNPCERAKRDFTARLRARYGDGKHLVFVHYQSTGFAQQGWIHNAADMDASQVVWARESSRTDDCRLADFYKDRTVWRLAEVSPKPVFEFLRPAPGAADAAETSRFQVECAALSPARSGDGRRP